MRPCWLIPIVMAAALALGSSLAQGFQGAGGGSQGNGGRRIGNFKGGHLGASSFDALGPGRRAPSANVPASNGGGNPTPDGNSGFLSRFGDSGAADGGDRPAGDGTLHGPASPYPRIPRRFGNTDLVQPGVNAGTGWEDENGNLNMGFGFFGGWPFFGGFGFGMNLGGGGSGGYGNGSGAPPVVNNIYGPSYAGPAPPVANDSASSAHLGQVPAPPQLAAPAPATRPAQSVRRDEGDDSDHARPFAEEGEQAFRAGRYQRAAYAWKHAVVDDPENGVLMLMLGQALFAAGQYEQAAGATQSAMRLLPQDRWGLVVDNYRELYGNARDYLDQLRTLDKTVKDQPAQPALRFLAGFHYAFLGYPRAAVEHLDKCLEDSPRDPLVRTLRDAMRERLTETTLPPDPPKPGVDEATESESSE